MDDFKAHFIKPGTTTNFGLDKCAVTHCVKEKIYRMCNIDVDEKQTIKYLGPADHYKYLGLKKRH